ncbi:hypothetical protein GCM10017653_36780 [Ancylobacter defluvii]|uniref:Uncharacterized protein n=1 Tax=Ancylobacter defluvii TaxID=1282440 RepID=A0A9W6JZY7_9HYPH|nr:hypothetical protein GCM10017653_36780 [Ancylobacter defluvii]
MLLVVRAASGRAASRRSRVSANARCGIRFERTDAVANTIERSARTVATSFAVASRTSGAGISEQASETGKGAPPADFTAEQPAA